MCNCDLKNHLELVQIALTCLGIIGAGIWAIFIFIRQRENKPRVEFSADIVFHKKIGDWWIVELLAYIENKGKVQKKLYNLNFDLASIEVNDPITLSQKYNNQVLFPNLIVKGSYLNNKTLYFFIEPGVKSKYSYIARVPANTQAVIFHTYFDYYKRGALYRRISKALKMKIIIRSHTAEATKIVPS